MERPENSQHFADKADMKAFHPPRKIETMRGMAVAPFYLLRLDSRLLQCVVANQVFA